MKPTISEWCPHCNLEVWIPPNRPSPCPNCGEELLPCAVCPVHDDYAKNCDWTKEKGCHVYPKEVK